MEENIVLEEYTGSVLRRLEAYFWRHYAVVTFVKWWTRLARSITTMSIGQSMTRRAAISSLGTMFMLSLKQTNLSMRHLNASALRKSPIARGWSFWTPPRLTVQRLQRGPRNLRTAWVRGRSPQLRLWAPHMLTCLDCQEGRTPMSLTAGVVLLEWLERTVHHNSFELLSHFVTWSLRLPMPNQLCMLCVCHHQVVPFHYQPTWSLANLPLLKAFAVSWDTGVMINTTLPLCQRLLPVYPLLWSFHQRTVPLAPGSCLWRSPMIHSFGIILRCVLRLWMRQLWWGSSEILERDELQSWMLGSFILPFVVSVSRMCHIILTVKNPHPGLSRTFPGEARPCRHGDSQTKSVPLRRSAVTVRCDLTVTWMPLSSSSTPLVSWELTLVILNCHHSVLKLFKVVDRLPDLSIDYVFMLMDPPIQCTSTGNQALWSEKGNLMLGPSWSLGKLFVLTLIKAAIWRSLAMRPNLFVTNVSYRTTRVRNESDLTSQSEKRFCGVDCGGSHTMWTHPQSSSQILWLLVTLLLGIAVPSPPILGIHSHGVYFKHLPPWCRTMISNYNMSLGTRGRFGMNAVTPLPSGPAIMYTGTSGKISTSEYGSASSQVFGGILRQRSKVCLQWMQLVSFIQLRQNCQKLTLNPHWTWLMRSTATKPCRCIWCWAWPVQMFRLLDVDQMAVQANWTTSNSSSMS